MSRTAHVTHRPTDGVWVIWNEHRQTVQLTESELLDVAAQIHVLQERDQTSYRTPSGHEYVEPSSVTGVRERLATYAQGIVECWDETELPPPPTWRTVGVLLQAVDGPENVYDRARLRLSQLLDALTEISVHPDRQSVNGASMFRRVFESVRAFVDEHEAVSKQEKGQEQ